MLRSTTKRVTIHPQTFDRDFNGDNKRKDLTNPIVREDGTVIKKPNIPIFLPDPKTTFWDDAYPVLLKNKKWFKIGLAIVGDVFMPNTMTQLLTLTQARKKMGQESKLKKLLFNLFAALRQVFWPYDVFEKTATGDVVYTGDTAQGKPLKHLGWSLFAKIMSLTLAGYGAVELFGIPISDLINLLVLL